VRSGGQIGSEGEGKENSGGWEKEVSACIGGGMEGKALAVLEGGEKNCE